MIGYAAETETVLTRADIDENFANKADWIHQIEEVPHKNGQGRVPRSAAGCRPDVWRKLVKLLDWVCPVETQNFSEGIMTPPYGNLEELSDDRSMEPSVCKSEKLKDEKGRCAEDSKMSAFKSLLSLELKNGRSPEGRNRRNHRSSNWSEHARDGCRTRQRTGQGDLWICARQVKVFSRVLQNVATDILRSFFWARTVTWRYIAAAKHESMLVSVERRAR